MGVLGFTAQAVGPGQHVAGFVVGEGDGFIGGGLDDGIDGFDHPAQVVVDKIRGLPLGVGDRGQVSYLNYRCPSGVHAQSTPTLLPFVAAFARKGADRF